MTIYIALGIWIIAAACGTAGLLVALTRQNGGLLYLLSLVVAGILGAVGAAFLDHYAAIAARARLTGSGENHD